MNQRLGTSDCYLFLISACRGGASIRPTQQLVDLPSITRPLASTVLPGAVSNHNRKWQRRQVFDLTAQFGYGGKIYSSTYLDGVEKIRVTLSALTRSCQSSASHPGRRIRRTGCMHLPYINNTTSDLTGSLPHPTNFNRRTSRTWRMVVLSARIRAPPSESRKSGPESASRGTRPPGKIVPE